MADDKTNKTPQATTQVGDTSAAPESEGSGSLTLDPSDKGGPPSSSPASGGSTEGSGEQPQTGSLPLDDDGSPGRQ
ncbi:MAG: hypothetical protein KIT87_24675 [Anaerolineae bacterium]|nr:hypothetical protein [Anaerolineae bacterium]